MTVIINNKNKTKAFYIHQWGVLLIDKFRGLMILILIYVKVKLSAQTSPMSKCEYRDSQHPPILLVFGWSPLYRYPPTILRDVQARGGNNLQGTPEKFEKKETNTMLIEYLILIISCDSQNHSPNIGSILNESFILAATEVWSIFVF